MCSVPAASTLPLLAAGTLRKAVIKCLIDSLQLSLKDGKLYSLLSYLLKKLKNV